MLSPQGLAHTRAPSWGGHLPTRESCAPRWGRRDGLADAWGQLPLRLALVPSRTGTWAWVWHSPSTKTTPRFS